MGFYQTNRRSQFTQAKGDCHAFTLTCRESEALFISLPGSEDTIEVRVMKAVSQVSLGIDAPLEVEVLREELVQN